MTAKILLGAASLALGACTVLTPEQQTLLAEKKNEIICKDELRTGSKIRRDPVCRTAYQWALIERESQGFVDGSRLNTVSVSDTFGN